MKKRLEAELISIAHRILKLKNHSELKQLHLETQKLYETLSVLKFVEENINIIQPKIDVELVEQKLEQSNDINDNNEPIALAKNVFEAVNDETEPELKEDFDNNISTANEEIHFEKESKNLELIEDETTTPELNEKENLLQPTEMPEIEVEDEDQAVEVEQIEEVVKEKVKENKSDKKQPIQVSFDEFKFTEPVFEKKTDADEKKLATLNEKLAKGINIGLNDKIAFVKNLFANSTEDYNRVLSQINSFDNYTETLAFINDFVKPDYDNWADKDEYVLRFMDAVEKKFV